MTKHAGGRPLKYESVEELENIIRLYFLAIKVHQTGDDKLLMDEDEDNLLIVNEIDDFIPTVSGLAYTLNMTTETLRAYGEKDQFSATIKRAKQKIEVSLEGRLSGTSPTGTIFNLKNNFGWKDKTEQEITVQPIDTKNASTEDLIYYQEHGKLPEPDPS